MHDRPHRRPGADAMSEIGTMIVVSPEGREGIWLADRASLKAWIAAQGFEEIHNFGTSAPGMLVGADHSVESVLSDIDEADKVAVLTGQARRDNVGHALALIMPPNHGLPERLEMYDIGEIPESVLQIDGQERTP